ncbi:hypothetical protein, unlikely [Trypanosoma brucei gambiense DAL972]|uniref:Uncharacterized protein n=1 Tax=Trypanosoma brucei gambiense (strain MHOM/CI/86/DAL972) TaxID=679716 RepID=D0A9X1_TRYB9|nr:hypothetical protein, unlikely [Trypanosoma brucei gambiense DAL972]CBH18472.1 hypothetical protein, unlikely [Trypanosoma brucei gambiense DAL972]|eukprot:XP_011780736.1 hypothetical protein, unlikely [Trypanosoma brucei gambiense DAL972]
MKRKGLHFPIIKYKRVFLFFFSFFLFFFFCFVSCFVLKVLSLFFSSLFFLFLFSFFLSIFCCFCFHLLLHCHLPFFFLFLPGKYKIIPFLFLSVLPTRFHGNTMTEREEF